MDVREGWGGGRGDWERERDTGGGGSRHERRGKGGGLLFETHLTHDLNSDAVSP